MTGAWLKAQMSQVDFCTCAGTVTIIVDDHETAYRDIKIVLRGLPTNSASTRAPAASGCTSG